MKNSLLTLFTIFFLMTTGNTQIIITEINYNSPDQDDIYEYLEIYNSSEDTIDMDGFKFTKGIRHSFTQIAFPPQSFMLLAKDSALIEDFGLNAIIWDNGGLKNSGEALILTDSFGATIDSVRYDDGGDWVSTPDGDGPSLELCDFTEDNAKGKFWKASVNSLNQTVNDKEMFGTPGQANSVSCENESQPKSLVINEILYNDGVGKDSLEFIEILNYSDESTDLKGYVLQSQSIDFSLPDITMQPYSTIVLAKYQNSIMYHFKVPAYEWGQGGLNNKADTIILMDNSGNIVDKVEYFEEGEWPSKADGQGYSLSLCDAKNDNNIGKNWQASPVYAGFTFKNNEVHANPGQLNYCTYDMDSLKKMDSSGIISNPHYNPFISGTVYGINFNPNGLQFVIKDDADKGIWTYSYNNNFGYTLHEGDKVALWGKLNQFKGLTQVRLDSVILLKTDSILNPAKIVEDLNESTEAELVTIKNVKLLDYTKWTNTGNGFNVKVANSKDTFSIRIDADTDIFGKPHPVGVFDITGLGGQYDKNVPLFDGYQLFPRYIEDINPYSAEDYPIKKINEVTETDNEGVGLSVGTNCELRGLVYGVNLRPSGLQFTIIDELNDGIGVFSKSEKFGYTVTEGDYVSIKGVIDQYNGLLQIKPDTIILISSGHTLYNSIPVTSLGEETESQLVTLKNLTIKDISKWKADGSSFNVTVTNGVNDFTMRIDNDVELSTAVAPDYTFNLTGIGGQYDSSKPYTEGYQILPRYALDIEKVSKVQNINNISFEIYPNPVSDFIQINANNKSGITAISIYSLNGQKVKSFRSFKNLNVKDIKNGVYKLAISFGETTVSRTFIKL